MTEDQLAMDPGSMISQKKRGHISFFGGGVNYLELEPYGNIEFHS